MKPSINDSIIKDDGDFHTFLRKRDTGDVHRAIWHEDNRISIEIGHPAFIGNRPKIILVIGEFFLNDEEEYEVKLYGTG